MNLVSEIKSFLEDEELITLFENKGFKPIFILDCFLLMNLKNNTIENLSILKDLKNKNRTRFKGEKWAFSINRDNNGKLYLDHLLIGDVKKEEFYFSLRHNIDQNNRNQFIIKFIDENNIKNIIKINDNRLILLKDYNNKKGTEQKRFAIYRNEQNQAVSLEDNSNYAKQIFDSLLSLEKIYPTLTAYIGQRIPFINDCLENIVSSKNNSVKTYQIKKKKQTNTNR